MVILRDSAVCVVFALLLMAGSSLAAMAPGSGLNNPVISTQMTAANASGGSFQLMANISLISNTTIPQFVLEQGPMAYAATQKSVLVIDTSTMNIVSSIKPDADNSVVEAVAVSPDGSYLYMVYSWEEHVSDPTGDYYNRYSRVVRINTTTDQPVDYFEIDNIYPEHLSVSPDGKIYLGYQDFSPESYGGVKIMDFQQGKMWQITSSQAMMMEEFAYYPTGNMIFYGGWYNPGALYSFDWSENQGAYYAIPGSTNNDDQYPRSVAVGRYGYMVYSAINLRKGIFAMDDIDEGKQVIPTDYYPLALAASSDGLTLYAIGYTYDSNNNKQYSIHKYSGLQLVGPYHSSLMDYAVTTPSKFYSSDSSGTVTAPDKDYPSNLAISGDGRYAFISTVYSDWMGNDIGDGIIIYDLSSMSQLKTISANDTVNDIAVSPSMIAFNPPPDYSWLQQSIGVPPSILNMSFPFVPTSFHPANDSFASNYKDEYFVIYATFSEPLDKSTVNGSTFWLTDQNGTVIPASVSASAKLAVLELNSTLDPDSDYVAHLSSRIGDKSGETLGVDYQWGFTTRNISSLPVPSINSTLNLSGTLRIMPPIQINITLQPQNGSSQNFSRPLVPRQMPEQNTSQGNTRPAPPQNSTQPALNSSAYATSGAPAANATASTNAAAPPPAQKDIFSQIIDFFKSILGVR